MSVTPAFEENSRPSTGRSRDLSGSQLLGRLLLPCCLLRLAVLRILLLDILDGLLPCCPPLGFPGGFVGIILFICNLGLRQRSRAGLSQSLRLGPLGQARHRVAVEKLARAMVGDVGVASRVDGDERLAVGR